MTESSYHSSSHIEGSSQNEDVSHGSADDSLFNYSTKESQRVKRSKATVLTVILALASLAGSLTYLVAWQQEKKTYIRVVSTHVGKDTATHSLRSIATLSRKPTACWMTRRLPRRSK